MCASSYLRFLSQIFTSSLSSSGLHILRPHLVFSRSDLHRRVTLSLSYHLQDFIVQLLSQLYNLILRLQNFISPRSRANRRLVQRMMAAYDLLCDCSFSTLALLAFQDDLHVQCSMMVFDLRGHTYCCGSERGPFHQ